MAEALEDFEFFSGQRQSLKSALNMRDIVDGKPFRFEVDKDEAVDFDSDDYDSDHDDKKKSDFLDADNYQLRPVDDTRIRIDEPILSFFLLEPRMEDIHDSGKIKKLIIKPGLGVQVAEDSKVFVHYAAFAEDMSPPFDTTVGRKSTPGFFLGDVGGTLPGFNIALKSMRIGEISQFMVYPEYAYGEVGAPPRIPPNCKVVFTVEMLRFVPKEKFTDIFFKSVDERANLPFQDIYEAGQNCKRKGNEKYKKSAYWDALKAYSRGILILEDYATANEEDNNKRDDLIAALCVNKAQTLLKVDQPARACNACKMALRTENREMKPKALLRFAEAKLMLESLDDAEKYCKQSIQLFKDFHVANYAPDKCHELLKKIKEAKIQQKKTEELLASRMLQLTT